MRRTLLILAMAILMAWMPAPAFAWGTSAHRYIMGRAIALLPAEIRPFFDHFRDELIVRAVDPDLWRVVGFDENQNHFLDFGVPEYGPDPFTTLPRDYGAALERFGAGTINRNGVLPWREAEMFGELRRAFASFATRNPFAPSDVVLFSAAVGHYIQDAHQPLHATNNFDGQLSGQRGIHSRFETELFERFEQRLAVNPAPASPLTNPRDTTFEVLLASYRLVPELLAADKRAIGDKTSYDDEYYERLFEQVKPMLERRLSESITYTASIILGAWTDAGRPALAISVPRGIERVRP